MNVCDKHQENPARVYSQCIGCELDYLRAQIEAVTADNDRLTSERDALANERYICDQLCAKLEADLAAAQAIISRFPKTADGVTVLPGDDVWTWFGNIGPVEAVTVQYRPRSGVYAQCYSTREAAEKARNQSNG